MPEAEKDENNVSTIIAVSKDDSEIPVNVSTNSTTGAIIVEIA